MVEWGHYKHMLDTFRNTLGMIISECMSYVIYHSIKDYEISQIKYLLPFNFSHIEEGIKYLGFRVKPNKYVTKDWFWIIKKVEARICHWSLKWLS